VATLTLSEKDSPCLTDLTRTSDFVGGPQPTFHAAQRVLFELVPGAEQK